MNKWNNNPRAKKMAKTKEDKPVEPVKVEKPVEVKPEPPVVVEIPQWQVSGGG